MSHFVIRARLGSHSPPLKRGNSRANRAMHSGRGFVAQPGQVIGSTVRRLLRISCQQWSHDRHNQWTTSQSATRASGALPHRGQAREPCPAAIGVESGKSSIRHPPVRLRSPCAGQPRCARGRSPIPAADSRQGEAAGARASDLRVRGIGRVSRDRPRRSATCSSPASPVLPRRSTSPGLGSSRFTRLAPRTTVSASA